MDAATSEAPPSDGDDGGRFSGGICKSDDEAATDVFGGAMDAAGVDDGREVGVTEVFTPLGVRSPTGSAMGVS